MSSSFSSIHGGAKRDVCIRKYVTSQPVQKPGFENDIEQFWKTIYDEPGVKNCILFEGVSPSFCNLARRIENPKIVHRSERNRVFSKS
jgi:hypothetical protein